MWLVIHSNNLPNHPVFLSAIQTPPGDGDGGNYSTQGVTRSYSLQWYAFKVPLTPVLLPTATAAANNAGGIGFVAADDLYSTNSLTRMPTSGPASYTLSGMPWFPNLNNVRSNAKGQFVLMAFRVLTHSHRRAASRGPAARWMSATRTPAKALITITTATPLGRSACTAVQATRR